MAMDVSDVKRTLSLNSNDDAKLIASLVPQNSLHNRLLTKKPVIDSQSLSAQQSNISEVTPRRKHAFTDVLNEMTSNRIAMEKRPILQQDSAIDTEIHTVIPTDTDVNGVILLSSRNRGSDWNLEHDQDDQPEVNGTHESEDSGFQVDIIDTVKPRDNCQMEKKEVDIRLPISPDRNEHKPVGQLHSTPLQSDTVRDLDNSEIETVAELPKNYKDNVDASNRRSSVKDLREQIKTVIDPALMRLQNRDFNKGPDQVLPADSFSTISASGTVKLKIDERGLSSIPPLSIPTLLQRTVSRHMDRPALCVKRNGEWIRWTYKQYLHDVQVCAKAFIRLGLERFHSVCILGFNAPEWFIANLAAIYAGGFAAGIYTTNSAEACLHCALNSQANIIVVEDHKQLEKILQIKDQIPSLKAIVQYTGKPHVEGIITWSQLMNLGNAASDNLCEERLKKMAVNQCCTIIYTSGTTGPPKGVMLSHDNLTWVSHVVVTYLNVRDGKDTFLSYLPLSHVAAQITDIYAPLSTGGTVFFAQPDALKGSLVETLREVRPTTFFGVPRVWEKIYEKMQAVGKTTRGVKRSIAIWAKKRGIDYNRRKMEGRNSKPFGFALANSLVFKKVRQALGMDRSWLVLSGAAPLSHEVAEYFMSLNIPIMEAYGMSESTGPHAINNSRGFRIGSAGKTIPGAVTKIHNPDNDGNGEILMGGRHVFMGYLNDASNTSSALNDEGYLCTGDIGHVDDFGFVYITGRLKELLITAGGENVAPVLIEDNIKAELPCISHAMVVGDRRKFLSVLLTLKTEVDVDTQEPLPVLTRPAREWCQEAGLSLAETVADIINAVERGRGAEKISNTSSLESEGAQFIKAIDTALERANKKSISNAQRVQKWTFLPVDFSIPGGELGPTMKVKRGIVAKKYTDVIERFYL